MGVNDFQILQVDVRFTFNMLVCYVVLIKIKTGI